MVKKTKPKTVKKTAAKKPKTESSKQAVGKKSVVKKSKKAPKITAAAATKTKTPASKKSEKKPVIVAEPTVQETKKTVLTPAQPLEQMQKRSEAKKREAVLKTEVVKPQAPEEPPPPKKLIVKTPIVVKELAEKLSFGPSELITHLIKLGVFANINQAIDFATASKVASELGFELQHPNIEEGTEVRTKPVQREGAKLVSRPPIVTFMGHVDHGKTSLLDAIRSTKVATKESGGITQHIGAYEVFLEKGAVTFLDTPGHEAFTAMRSRGAKATDIVVVVVAADDGIKPQTEEAIDHALAADATIVVAINKIDLPSANVDRVKKQLSERELVPEDWGGKTVVQCVSAKTGEGIDALLEFLLLESELLELKADRDLPAQGVVIEARLSKGKGPVATVLIQNGTLRVGDAIICGDYYGRVRAMTNDRGARTDKALPSMPVEIAGLSGVPRAGDIFNVVKSESVARDTLEKKHLEALERGDHKHAHIRLEDVYAEIRSGNIKTLNLVVKADVQGSIEAIRNVLRQITSDEVQLKMIHTGIGNITKSDVMLAAASNAIVIGFHVNVVADAEETMKVEDVDVRIYPVIYRVKEAMEKAVKGLLTPTRTEKFIGSAEVRQIFKVSKVGAIAGCMVTKGKMLRNAQCRVFRNGKELLDSKITGLKRFKDDAREVAQGFECGVSLAASANLQQGDRIDAFHVEMKVE